MKKIYTLSLLLMACLSMSGQLIINEVLYDPSNNNLDGDANGDGAYDQEEDSFIEFFNTSNTNFDASGYQIWDDTTSGQLRYVIPAGTWVPPHGALVVFGGGTLVGSFGNAVVLKTDSAVGMNLNNSGEVIVIKDPNGSTVLTFDSDALSNNPNESYTRVPDITGTTFLQHGDTTNVLFSPGTKTDGSPFDTLFVVSSLSVQGQGGATTITTKGGTLQMEATALPTFADDKTVTWSVPAANGVATISATGLLTATANGVVWVKATANDASGISDSVEITISNQDIGLREPIATSLALYPNPTASKLYLKGGNASMQLQIFSLSGQLLKEVSYNAEGISTEELQKGVYLLKVVSEREQPTLRFVKL